jgi:hypothetical protein
VNSPSARKNASRPTNPARMRLLLADEKPCDCGKPSTIRIPIGDGSGKYESSCTECATGFQPFDTREAAILELEEMLALLEDLD